MNLKDTESQGTVYFDAQIKDMENQEYINDKVQKL